MITTPPAGARFRIANETLLVDIGLSPRAYNCLARAGYRTVGKVRSLSDREILRIRNLGVGLLSEIRQRLEETVNLGMD